MAIAVKKARTYQNPYVSVYASRQRFSHLSFSFSGNRRITEYFSSHRYDALIAQL